MADSPVGIYIKTFKPDHYLAKALIASLRHFAPHVDITIVPDDGFSQATLWGEKVLQTDDPFLQSLRGYFKKLWVFYGPYDRFIYLDADMLALRPLAPLVSRVDSATKPFFLACAETKIVRALETADEPHRLSIHTQHLGDLDLMVEFAPEHDCTAAFPFNSGVFATHRDVIPLPVLRDVFESAQAFHRSRSIPPLATSREGLFMGDQGLINYLVKRQGVPLDLVHDLFVWGGCDFATPEDSAPEFQQDPFKHMFVHWAGCPRPTLLNSRVPGGARWREFHRDYYRGHGSTSLFAADLLKQVAREAVTNVRRRFHRRVPPA